MFIPSRQIWISAFMLVGAAHPGATVGDVEKTHGDEVKALIEELAKGVAESENVVFCENLAARLYAYARSVAHFPTALKEQPWRNGWFVAASEAAAAAGNKDPFPLHSELMAAVAKKS